MNMNININTQTGLLLKNLLDFYSNPENIKQLLNIVNGNSNLSLRIIDWFVTNYSKKYFIVYDINENEQRFKVYNDYKLNLKAFSKKLYDPFQRWERITIPLNENEIFTTTIGQLNFFKWAITHRVLEYLIEHYENIEKDMVERNTISKKKKMENSAGGGTNGDTKTRKKREELSISACKTVKKENIDIIIKFR